MYQDGPCKGEDTDAVTNVKTMDDIKGDWWALYVWKNNRHRSLHAGGCYGGSTVVSSPTLVATTGIHANMNDSYSRWYCDGDKKAQHAVFDWSSLPIWVVLKTKVAGQWTVDQQCDLLWRNAQQMRHRHNCHHCKCVDNSSRGELAQWNNQADLILH